MAPFLYSNIFEFFEITISRGIICVNKRTIIVHTILIYFKISILITEVNLKFMSCDWMNNV